MPSTPRSPSRSTRTQAAVLVAAWQLFVERQLRGVTIEAIAERSGVAKTTIYRQWPTRNAVLLDALHAHFDTTIRFPDTGTLRADLKRQVRAVIRLLNSDVGHAYVELIGESQHDATLAAELRERYISHRRLAATEAIQRGIDRGELPPGSDPAVLIDAIYGALYYRFLVSHEPTSAGYAARIVDTVLGEAAS